MFEGVDVVVAAPRETALRSSYILTAAATDGSEVRERWQRTHVLRGTGVSRTKPAGSSNTRHTRTARGDRWRRPPGARGPIRAATRPAGTGWATPRQPQARGTDGPGANAPHHRGAEEEHVPPRGYSRTDQRVHPVHGCSPHFIANFLPCVPGGVNPRVSRASITRVGERPAFAKLTRSACLAGRAMQHVAARRRWSARHRRAGCSGQPQ